MMPWLIWVLMMLSAAGALVLHSPGLLMLAALLLSIGLIVDGRRMRA